MFKLETPVAFIIFNRPDTTERVFAEIAKAKPPKLLVVADGARTNKIGEAEKVAATRAIIQRVDWDCEVLTNFSEVNLGCKVRVSSGIDWVFEQVEEAIILEDDCLPDATFFRFCQEMLSKYRVDTRIVSICGTNIQKDISIDSSFFFSRFSLMWGWATWKRAWSQYDIKMDEWPRLRETNWLEKLGIKNYFFKRTWTANFDYVHYNNFDTWDYQWIYTCWRIGGLTIIPKFNLIENIGFNASATHTTSEHPVLSKLSVDKMQWPLISPKNFAVHYGVDEFIDKNWFGSSFESIFKEYLLKFQIVDFLNKKKKIFKVFFDDYL